MPDNFPSGAPHVQMGSTLRAFQIHRFFMRIHQFFSHLIFSAGTIPVVRLVPAAGNGFSIEKWIRWQTKTEIDIYPDLDHESGLLRFGG
jgi:hypothetical protein